MRLACVSQDQLDLPKLACIAQALNIPLIDKEIPINDVDYVLVFEQDILQLIPVDKNVGGPLFVDFHSAAMEYRRATSGIQQDVAKAVGCRQGFRPIVLDATAGLGTDAFILASVGCNVTLLENNAVIFALLENGIQRAILGGGEVASIVSLRMHLQLRQNALDFLGSTTNDYDVVYLDPMFPERQKSAKVKKTMQYFHYIVGYAHAQEIELLNMARHIARKRVVVKRPKLAPLLAGQTPDYQLKGKSVRYDIYLTIGKT